MAKLSPQNAAELVIFLSDAQVDLLLIALLEYGQTPLRETNLVTVSDLCLLLVQRNFHLKNYLLISRPELTQFSPAPRLRCKNLRLTFNLHSRCLSLPSKTSQRRRTLKEFSTSSKQNTTVSFLVGAFFYKRARILQSLVFFCF